MTIVLTNVAHLDLVAHDGRVVEPGGRLPREEDVRVRHGFNHGGVGRVGDIAEDHADGGNGLKKGDCERSQL